MLGELAREHRGVGHAAEVLRALELCEQRRRVGEAACHGRRQFAAAGGVARRAGRVQAPGRGRGSRSWSRIVPCTACCGCARHALPHLLKPKFPPAAAGRRPRGSHRWCAFRRLRRRWSYVLSDDSSRQLHTLCAVPCWELSGSVTRRRHSACAASVEPRAARVSKGAWRCCAPGKPKLLCCCGCCGQRSVHGPCGPPGRRALHAQKRTVALLRQ